MQNDLESWFVDIIRKRPDCALLIHAMLLHGLRIGRVSAEDVHHIPVSHANCRGAATRLLPRFGFCKHHLIRGKTKAAHKHLLWSWQLEHPAKAQQALICLKNVLCDVKQKEPDQLNLL